MFKSVAKGFSQALNKVMGEKKITEKVLDNCLLDIKKSLIESDTSIVVVEHLLENIRKIAKDKVLEKGEDGKQYLYKLVYDQLVDLFTSKEKGKLILPEHKFCKLMLVGPQGCGKTTLMGKIAYEYKRQGRKVALTSVDFARPAAIEQAKQLSKTAECTYFDTDQFGSIASNLQATASLVDSKGYDLLLIDTAGRQFVDQDLMDEVSVLQSALQPNEVIYVVDALSGQNAAQSAKQFADSVHVTGLALTKADGDALAGAALSAVYMTGKPIKLVGRGERITDLDDVDPQSLAGQILNLGDLSSLIKEFEKRGVMKVPPNAKEIDMLQLRDQIKTWLDIGVENILGRLPGMASMPKEMTKSFDSKMLVKMAAVIDSMTKQERLTQQSFDLVEKKE